MEAIKRKKIKEKLREYIHLMEDGEMTQEELNEEIKQLDVFETEMLENDENVETR